MACAICSHPQRGAIEGSIGATGGSFDVVAVEYNLEPQQLRAHYNQCQVPVPVARAGTIGPDYAMAQVAQTMGQLNRKIAAHESRGSVEGAEWLATIKAKTRLLELLLKNTKPATTAIDGFLKKEIL
jgi:hypothetical protein